MGSCPILTSNSTDDYLIVNDPSSFFVEDRWNLHSDFPYMNVYVPFNKVAWNFSIWEKWRLITVAGEKVEPPKGVINLWDEQINGFSGVENEPTLKMNLWLDRGLKWKKNNNFGDYLFNPYRNLNVSMDIYTNSDNFLSYQVSIEAKDRRNITVYKDNTIIPINEQRFFMPSFSINLTEQSFPGSGGPYMLFMSLWKFDPYLNNTTDLYDFVGPIEFNIAPAITPTPIVTTSHSPSRTEAVQAVLDYFSGRKNKQEAIDVVMLYFSG